MLCYISSLPVDDDSGESQDLGISPDFSFFARQLGGLIFRRISGNTRTNSPNFMRICGL